MPNRIPDPRAGGSDGNGLPGAVSINRPSAEKVGEVNAPATALHTHVASAYPTVEVLIDGSLSRIDLAVLDIRLPRGLNIPRHVWRDRGISAHLVDGALELSEDDRLPVVVRAGTITVTRDRPISARVLAPARLVALLEPPASAELLAAAAAPEVLPDDRAALLAAAGIALLPELRRR